MKLWLVIFFCYTFVAPTNWCWRMRCLSVLYSGENHTLFDKVSWWPEYLDHGKLKIPSNTEGHTNRNEHRRLGRSRVCVESIRGWILNFEINYSYSLLFFPEKRPDLPFTFFEPQKFTTFRKGFHFYVYGCIQSWIKKGDTSSSNCRLEHVFDSRIWMYFQIYFCHS